MDELMSYSYPKVKEIAAVVDEIVQLLRPECVYLYNHKVNPAGETTAFKLCVISRFEGFLDREDAERAIYTSIDCDVPYDVLLYTQEEWRRLCDRSDSFARKIFLTGTVVYG